MKNIETLYQELLQPSDALVADMAKIKGDIIILGVGGKMGPGLARVARQAVEKAGLKKRIIGVARFSGAGATSTAGGRRHRDHQRRSVG